MHLSVKKIPHRKYAFSSKTLLINTLNSGRVNPLPSSMYRSYNRIPQSKSMHIILRGHIETDPSTSSYFVTLSLEYPKALCLIWTNWPFRFQMQASIQITCKSLGLFDFSSNPVFKVYQHRSRNGGILVIAWSTGSLRQNSKRHCCCVVNTRSIRGQGRT